MLDPTIAELVVGGALGFDPEDLQRRYDAERTRRLRPDGTAQYAGATGAFEDFGKDPWVSEPPARDSIDEHSTVIIIGGGFAGLVMGARLREAGVDDIRVVEAAGDFGGTWYWNRYPGAMCDIEAHIYMPLLEEMGYAPKDRYASATELFEHSRAIGEKYGLYDKACFHTRVVSARWRNDQVWEVTTDRHDRLTCDHLVIAGGRQSLPKVPRIPGIEHFGGHVFHSSRWDYGYTGGAEDGRLTGLADKVVGVIGTGATALQIVPAAAKWARELLVFQRTPSAVGPRGNRPTPPDWVDTSSPGWQKRRRETFQRHINGDVPAVDEINDGWTDYATRIIPPVEVLERELGRTPTPAELDTAKRVQDFLLMNQIRDRIDQTVHDRETAEALKPWYRWLCKRPGWHDEYLEAFNRPNVRLVDTHGLGVEAFTRTGVVIGGEELDVDAIVVATGFESDISYTHLLGFDPIGRTGMSLSERWTPHPRTWFGIMAEEFPNLFLIGANQQTAAAVNATHMIDEHAGHVAHIIGELHSRGDLVAEPTAGSVTDYLDLLARHTDRELLGFFAECTPGYFNKEGRATRQEDLYYGGRVSDPLIYFRLLEAWRDEGEMAGLELSSRRTTTSSSGDCADAAFA